MSFLPNRCCVLNVASGEQIAPPGVWTYANVYGGTLVIPKGTLVKVLRRVVVRNGKPHWRHRKNVRGPARFKVTDWRDDGPQLDPEVQSEMW